MEDQAEQEYQLEWPKVSGKFVVQTSLGWLQYLKLDSEKMRLELVWHILFLAMCICRNLACEISEVRNQV